ncbi:MAG: response regulator, partial [Synechococcaceae cyanobacterium RL_1_2]|nr:response regulator [Synechococcaceae cyanobacterium RL_1_2]
THLDRLSRQRGNGKLLLRTAEGVTIVKVDLLAGRLLLATHTLHQARRWYRALKFHCPGWRPNPQSLLDHDLWEYQLLYQGVMNKKLTVTQGKAVLRAIAREIFFDCNFWPDAQWHWLERDQDESGLSLTLSLSYLEVEPVLLKTLDLYTQWFEKGLGRLSPTVSPLAVANLEENVKWGKYFLGTLTLWDFIAATHLDLLRWADILIPLFQRKGLQLFQLPDLPIPIASDQDNITKVNQTLTLSDQGDQGLILCLTPDQECYYQINTVLATLGYSTVNFTQPLIELPHIIATAPKLIFLDFDFSTIDSYQFAEVLKHTYSLAHIPIVAMGDTIMTLDQRKAKVVGVAGFLAKSFTSTQLMNCIHNYLYIEEATTD